MNKAFTLFADLLGERLADEVTTTEDTVRYTFFYALLSTSSCSHKDIIIETPHSGIKGKKKVDFVVTARDDRPSMVFEFKYDRRIPSGRNLNTTNRAGAVFNDIFLRYWS
jgi:hypothetical protein